MELVSFSYRVMLPPKADLVFDCRDLANPYKVDALRPLDGRDERVQKYVMNCASAQEMLAQLTDTVPGRKDIQRIAFGCLGGRHRSVAMVEVFAARLRKLGENPTITHMNL